MRDANIAEPSKAVVQSIEFHPHGQVLMTAGMDKRLRFFQARPVLLIADASRANRDCVCQPYRATPETMLLTALQGGTAHVDVELLIDVAEKS